MGLKTGISWTNSSFNPWIGCAKVSAGCEFCYAMRDNTRHHWAIWGPRGTRVRTSESNWKKPLTWNRAAEKSKKPHFVFCASLADVFESFTGGVITSIGALVDSSLDVWRKQLFALMEATPYLTWLVLTKRIENVKEMVPANWLLGAWPKNVWIGTTIENQRMAEQRLLYLLSLPAPVRFVSVEPMLDHVDLNRVRVGPAIDKGERYFSALSPDMNTGAYRPEHMVDWVICGGESGVDFRPVEVDDVLFLRDQCVAAGVDFFFKQWGGATKIDGHWGGEELDGEIWHERPDPALIAA
jgi:Bacteriophage protein gp37